MAAAMAKFDDLFFGILQNCEQIEPFLDVVFSFLARRTDFFRIMHSKNDKMGFPAGVAEKMVLQIFRKYQNLVSASDPKQVKTTKVIATKSQQKMETSKATISTINEADVSPTSDQQVAMPTPTDLPPVVSTVEVSTIERDDSNHEEPQEQVNAMDTSQAMGQSTAEQISTPSEAQQSSSTTTADPKKTTDCFNGDVLENYMWSQTGREIDIRIPVPSSIKGKDIVVDMTNNHLKVALKDTHPEGPKVYIDGDLQWKIHEDESLWTLIRGEYIQVTLDKVEDRWWTCVIKGDREIDKSKIDTTRDITEFDEQTQHDYQKVMFDHRQKMMGKPTSEEMKTHDMLRKAWDAPNSPFAGTPFDPSKVNISGNLP